MTEPYWMEIARSHLGAREYTPQRPGPNGEASNPLIEGWQKLAGIRHPDDEIPWCAAFVTGVMHEAGLTDFATSAARAWNRYGTACTPRPGCIVALWRDSPSSPHGHVGFLVGDDAHGGVMLLGGNQANAVLIRPYARARVLGYRWPTAAQLASAHLDGDGRRVTS